ncbi:mechanosensitive ion channel family protein [Candidatus Omnitrophota bacterium]
MSQELLNQTLAGNTVLDYGIAVGWFIIGCIVVRIFQSVILRRLTKWAEKTTTTIDDFIVRLIRRTAIPLAYFGTLYLCVSTLTMESYAKKIINSVAIAVLIFAVARFAITFLNYGVKLYVIRLGRDEATERSMKGMLRIATFAIWALALIFFLDNLGFKISAVIAGLGIGGVAVALAAQAILGDLFSYFSILFDRPFEIGDFIIIGDFLGTIEHIGIKTTRIRSLGGEQLIFSNTDLTNSRVRNYKRMEKRRVVFKLGVTYNTPLAKVKQIPSMIENIIKKVKDTVFDRAHFFSYGDFNLVIEVVYYVMSSDYNKYMDIQQEINFAIKDAFEKSKIEFAFPTQTLYVNQEEKMKIKKRN